MGVFIAQLTLRHLSEAIEKLVFERTLDFGERRAARRRSKPSFDILEARRVMDDSPPPVTFYASALAGAGDDGGNGSGNEVALPDGASYYSMPWTGTLSSTPPNIFPDGAWLPTGFTYSTNPGTWASQYSSSASAGGAVISQLDAKDASIQSTIQQVLGYLGVNQNTDTAYWNSLVGLYNQGLTYDESSDPRIASYNNLAASADYAGNVAQNAANSYAGSATQILDESQGESGSTLRWDQIVQRLYIIERDEQQLVAYQNYNATTGDQSLAVITEVQDIQNEQTVLKTGISTGPATPSTPPFTPIDTPPASTLLSLNATISSQPTSSSTTVTASSPTSPSSSGPADPSPENPQTRNSNTNGYISEEYIAHATKRITAATVMKLLEQYPSRDFPFPIRNDDAQHSKGPIRGGQYYWLDPVNILGASIKPGVLQARNVTKTSFTLFVTNKLPYIVPAGSYITFSTFVDSSGDVVLKQQGVLADPNLINLWLDQWGGPQKWQQQAANLRQSIH